MRVTRGHNASWLILVQYGAHTEDAFGPLLLRKAGVLQAQIFELNFIKEWLEMS